MSKRQVPAYKLIGKVCRWQTPHHKRVGVGPNVLLLKELREDSRVEQLREDSRVELRVKNASALFFVSDVYQLDVSLPFAPAEIYCKVLFQDGSCWWTPYKMNWHDAVPNIIIAGPRRALPGQRILRMTQVRS